MHAFDRNSVSALVALGHCKAETGSIEEVILLMEQAVRLNPLDPQIAVMYYRIGEVHLLRSRSDEAITSLERARSANLELAYVHASLASAYSLEGETELAAPSSAQLDSSEMVIQASPNRLPDFSRCRRPVPCSQPPISLVCASPACRRNDRHGLRDEGSRLDATVRRKRSARSASRPPGRCDRDGGRCRSVRQIALR
jgi:tetratricopeptide (TPR) repeat protein